MNLTLSGNAPAATQIECIEAELVRLPQVDCPLVHRFAPGVYLREIFMPAGTFVIGHQHKTRHFNIVLRGRARVSIDGVVQIIEAPCTFLSDVDVRKVLYIEEDMVWQTVHPTDETDLDRLEDMLIVKSASYQKHLEDLRALKRLVSEVSI